MTKPPTERERIWRAKHLPIDQVIGEAVNRRIEVDGDVKDAPLLTPKSFRHRLVRGPWRVCEQCGHKACKCEYSKERGE